MSPVSSLDGVRASMERMPEHEHKAPTRLILVRHAVTAHTGGKLSGRMPGIDLTDEGRKQADAAAARLASAPIAIVYASPIERTMQTAQAIAARHNLAVQPLDGVIEAEYGDWTDKTLGELAKTDEWKVVQRAPSRARFPNGESLFEMQARMVIALDQVVARHHHETVVVVSHADPIKAAVAHYTGIHLDLFQRINISPASATVFEFHPHGVMMLTCNDTGTLDKMLAPPPPRSETDGAAAENGKGDGTQASGAATHA
jgi:probable phosphoglycerate mutase